MYSRQYHIWYCRLFDKDMGEEAKFLECPECGCNSGIAVKVKYCTVLKNFPMYCRRCKGHWETTYSDGVQTSCKEDEED